MQDGEWPAVRPESVAGESVHAQEGVSKVHRKPERGIDRSEAGSDFILRLMGSMVGGRQTL